MLRKSLALSILVGILVLTVSILAAAQDTNTGKPSVVKGTNALPIGKVDPDADIVFDLSPGTGAPPATLGGYAMTPVPYPGAPGCTGITPPGPIKTPVGSGITVSPWASQRCIGAGWATWSHGYKGDVYFSEG